jgi:hypothetical protein
MKKKLNFNATLKNLLRINAQSSQAMDIYTFLSLSKDEQEKAVSDADFLSERTETSYRVKLYSVEDFYVEVFLTSAATEIVKFKAFKSRRLLIPYLDNLNLDQPNQTPIYG